MQNNGRGDSTNDRMIEEERNRECVSKNTAAASDPREWPSEEKRRSGAELGNCQKSAKQPMKVVIEQMATEGIDSFRESRRESR